MSIRTLLTVALLAAPTLLPAQITSPLVTRDADGTLRLLAPPVEPPSVAAPSAGGDEQWDPVFAGPQRVGLVDVRAIAVTPTHIYVGGHFREIAGVAANNIARFDRTSATWSPLGSDSTNGADGAVHTLLAHEGSIYVGGRFSSAGGVASVAVARFDGERWHRADSGLSAKSSVWAFAMYRGRLHAAGAVASGTSAGLARLDSNGWRTLVSAGGGSIGTLEVLDDELLAGGFLVRIGDSINSSALAWNGECWRTLVPSQGFNIHMIHDFAVSPSGELYASGNFTDDSLESVVRYEEGAWHPVGRAVRRGRSGLQESVHAIEFAPNGDLYAGGQWIDSAGNVSVVDIARWDGSEWSDVGGVYYGVHDLAFAGDTLVVAGRFTRAGGVSAHGLARYVSGAWSAFGDVHQPGGIVRALVRAADGAVYAGGSFETAGGIGVNNVARWHDEEWSALGTGVTASVSALHFDAAGDLWLGGSYLTRAGDASVEALARFDGASWSAHPVSWSNSNEVTAITSNARGLYVAGSIYLRGSTSGTDAPGPVHWDGQSWQSLGNGVRGRVDRLLAIGDSIVAAGAFDVAGNTPASSIALWTGIEWQSLESGLPNPATIGALSLWRGDLVVGGRFTGGGSANLARWDFDARLWRPMPTVDGPVYALETIGDDLYLAGDFTVDSAKGLARTDGQSVTQLGSGLDFEARALVADARGRLYVGGAFTRAGGLASAGIARWLGSILSVGSESGTTRVDASAEPNVIASSTTLRFSLARAAHVRIALVDVLGRSLTTLHDAPLAAGTHAPIVDATAVAPGAYYLRILVDGDASVVPVRIVR